MLKAKMAKKQRPKRFFAEDEATEVEKTILCKSFFIYVMLVIIFAP